jgi:RecA/RadA recombinase
VGKLAPRVEQQRGELRRAGAYFVEEDVEFLSSGCTLLDCALGGGFAFGRMENLIGDKSTGKCLCPDSFLLTEDGLMQIGEIAESLGSPSGDVPWQKGLALDRTTRVGASHFHTSYSDSIIRIATEHGFELGGRSVHPILVMGPDGFLTMRKMEELKVGDYAVIAPGPKLFPDSYVMLPDAAQFRCDIVDKEWAASFAHPTKVTAEFGSLLGLMVADGGWENSPRISATKEWEIAEYTRCALSVFGVKPRGRNDSEWALPKRVSFYLRYLFGVDGGLTAPFKFVPPAVLRSPVDVQRAFLKVLISCDGSIEGNGFSYTSASLRLVKEVQMMLLNFGVVATRGSRDVTLEGWTEPRTYYNLSAYGQRFDVFLREIGSFKDNREEHCVRETSSYMSLPFVMGVVLAAIDDARRRVGWSSNGTTAIGVRFPKIKVIGRANEGVQLTYSMLQEVLEVLREWLDPVLVAYFDDLLAKKYVFEKIVTVDQSSQRQLVHDVHVPAGHLFWSNGFVSHNTGLGIEAMAQFDIAYPDEGQIYYREAEAAFSRAYGSRLGMPKRARMWKDDYGDKPFDTVEDLFEDLDRVLDQTSGGRSLYIVDSLDALSDRASMDRDMSKGSFGMTKQKKMGELFQKLVRRMEASRMCFLIISQVREAIGVTFGDKLRRSGGKSLDFFASHCAWLAYTGREKRTIGGVERVVGVKIKANIKKNKVGNPWREANFLYRFNYGIDDLWSCVQWLHEVKRLDSALGYKDPSAFLKMAEKTRGEDYRTICQDVATVTKAAWIEIDNTFMPIRSKYGEEMSQ